MADATHAQPSADLEPASEPPARRGLSIDPDERPVFVLSTEPPARMSPEVARTLAIAKKAGIVLVAALFGLILLAFIVETGDQPIRTPTQGPSMRG